MAKLSNPPKEISPRKLRARGPECVDSTVRVIDNWPGLYATPTALKCAACTYNEFAKIFQQNL